MTNPFIGPQGDYAVLQNENLRLIDLLQRAHEREHSYIEKDITLVSNLRALLKQVEPIIQTHIVRHTKKSLKSKNPARAAYHDDKAKASITWMLQWEALK